MDNPDKPIKAKEVSISIITVSLNSEKYIADTIKSVKNQTYSHKEHIIIDGASTDSTVSIISQYEDDIAYWVSEPDNGIANAMNKGIEQAKGDYLLFLNSDDYLLNNDVLHNVATQLDQTVDINAFKVLYLYTDGRTAYSFHKKLGILTNFKMSSGHQGQFVSRKLITNLGNFDETFKLAFDYDFLLRAYRKRASSKLYTDTVSIMRQVGITSSDSSRKNWDSLQYRFNEEKAIHFKNSQTKMMSMVYRLYWFLYLPYRRLRFSLSS